VKILMDQISICESLLKWNKPFLKRFITGDEKWITYDNNVWKRSKQGKAPQTGKPRSDTKKSDALWWEWKGIVHYELLPSGQTIDSNLYCQQLEKLCQAIERKWSELINRKGIVFYHDNALHIFGNPSKIERT